MIHRRGASWRTSSSNLSTPAGCVPWFQFLRRICRSTQRCRQSTSSSACPFFACLWSFIEILRLILSMCPSHFCFHRFTVARRSSYGPICFMTGFCTCSLVIRSSTSSHFYMGLMFDDISLHVARSYTTPVNRPFSLISSHTLSNHLLLCLSLLFSCTSITIAIRPLFISHAHTTSTFFLHFLWDFPNSHSLPQHNRNIWFLLIEGIDNISRFRHS